jgi:hypothetical protein
MDSETEAITTKGRGYNCETEHSHSGSARKEVRCFSTAHKKSFEQIRNDKLFRVTRNVHKENEERKEEKLTGKCGVVRVRFAFCA